LGIWPAAAERNPLRRCEKIAVGALKTDLLISVWAGNERAYYARWVEFGTQASTVGQRVADKRRKKTGATRIAKRSHSGTRAQPFFYPAYRAMKKTVTSRIQRAVNAAVRKVSNNGTV
jgi:HK97 gp10 family phage protein